MKLLFATGNEYKFNLMKNRLKDLKDVELVMPKMLGISINVIEDGNTPEENALKKAKAYYDVLKIPTIAEDSGLYIDKFSDEDQPGLFVKRINGKEDCSDEEILESYINKLEKYGGESLASYHTGVCLIDSDGKIYQDTIEETKFLMTSKRNDIQTMSGGILDCISYDLECNKYFNERTEEDKKVHYKSLDSEYVKIVSNIIK